MPSGVERLSCLIGAFVNKDDNKADQIAKLQPIDIQGSLYYLKSHSHCDMNVESSINTSLLILAVA